MIKTIDCLLMLFIVGCCQAPDNNPSIDDNVHPLWATRTCNQGPIWNRGIESIVKYGDIIITNTSLNEHSGVEDNRLCGLNIDNGKIKWYFPQDTNTIHNEQFDDYGYIYDNLMVLKSTVRGDIKKTEEIICFNLDTQQELWRKDLTKFADASIASICGHQADCYFFQQCGFDKSYIYQADVHNGDTTRIQTITPKFEYPYLCIDDVKLLVSTPSIPRGLVFTTFEYNQNRQSCSTIQLLDLDNYTIAQSTANINEPNYSIGSCMAVDNNLFVCKSGYMACYNVNDFSIKWEYARKNSGSLIIYHKGIIFKYGANMYVGLDAQTGKELYASDNGSMWAYSVGDYVYFCDRSCKLRILDIKTGRLLDTLECPEEKWSPDGGRFNGGTRCLVDDGKLYIMSATSVYCFPAYPWNKSE